MAVDTHAMMTIFIIYSPDRLKQLEQSIECLKRLSGYADCEKILCVDGRANVRPDSWTVVEIPRKHRHFSWADSWNAAVERASFETMLMLDSDRILPRNYLELVTTAVKDMTFAYSGSLFRAERDCRQDELFAFQDEAEINFPIRPEKRQACPPDASVTRAGKNPMSGNTGLTRSTYRVTGGIDPTFVGWGYVDTDYYVKTHRMKCEYVALPARELHLHHGYGVNDFEFHRNNVWNQIKFLRKWGFEVSDGLLESAASYRIDPDTIRPDKSYPVSIML